MSNRPLFDEHARQWVEKYAKKEFTAMVVRLSPITILRRTADDGQTAEDAEEEDEEEEEEEEEEEDQ